MTVYKDGFVGIHITIKYSLKFVRYISINILIHDAESLN